ncbi:hypothetical protein EXT65_21295 [Pectobacterium carotovorum subsp. carotovorum]|nr:hypothetical protein [Pectobacterium carotovorum subsp. carotovorum]
MYEYIDVYDEAENGGEDGKPIFLTRLQVISWLKKHGHVRPAEWFVFFKESNTICTNRYSAYSLLQWLNY